MSANQLTAPERFLDEDKPLALALTCSEVREALDLSSDCCSSCHDDWDEGYDSPIEYEYEDDEGYHVWARVCCRVGGDLDEAGVAH